MVPSEEGSAPVDGTRGGGSDDADQLPRPARPAPLLAVALGMMAGIAGGHALGATAGWPAAAGMGIGVGLMGLGLAVHGYIGRRATAALVCVVAAAAGLARERAAVVLPGNHIAHLAPDRPMVSRLEGVVVTTPTLRPAVLRNPFLAYEPAPRLDFVVRAVALRANGTRWVCGYVRVSVQVAEGVVGGARTQASGAFSQGSGDAVGSEQDMRARRPHDAGGAERNRLAEQSEREADRRHPDQPDGEAGSSDAHMRAVKLGSRVVLTGKLYRSPRRRNPGGFDRARWDRLQGIHAGMFVERMALVKFVAAPGAVARIVDRLRSTARAWLFEPFDQADGLGEGNEPLGLLDAMVLGHRSSVSAALNEAFARTGALHLLAVSGFHVALLAGAVWWVLGLLRCPPRVAAAVTMGVMVLYAVVAEPNAPILRATTMGVLVCTARLLGRPICWLNALAVAAVCVLLINPLELYRPGFQLSFVEVLALLLLFPAVQRRFARLGRWAGGGDARSWGELLARWLVRAGLVSVLAWLVALPLVMFHFERFAPWAPVDALLITPLAAGTIVAGFLVVLVGGVLGPAGVVLGALLKAITAGLLWLVHLLAAVPGTLIATAAPPLWIIWVTYAIVLAAWLAGRRRLAVWDGRRWWRRPAWVAAMMIGALWVGRGMAGYVQRSAAGVEVHILAVADGSAGLVELSDGEGLVFDAGTLGNFDAGRVVADAAEAVGVRRLGVVSISHANYDHFSGLATIGQRLRPTEMWVSPYFERALGERARALLAEAMPAVRRRRVAAGYQVRRGEATVEVLWPPEDLGETVAANDRSLVVRLTFGGRRVLFTGDIERVAMEGLLAGDTRRLRADVLIAPHHGAVLESVTGRFYEAVSPRVVIVSTGRVRPKLVRMLRERFAGRVVLYSTEDVGDVVVRTAPDGHLEVATPYGGR